MQSYFFATSPNSASHMARVDAQRRSIANCDAFQTLHPPPLPCEWSLCSILKSILSRDSATLTNETTTVVTKFQLAKNAVKHTFEAINTSAIHHAGSILLHKRRIENNQSIPTN